MRLAAAIAGLLAAMPVKAEAQSLHPMRAETKSVSDQFAIRVHPGNPYAHKIKVEVHVYDETFREIEAQVLPREAMIAPNDSRNVMVIVPFDGKTERRVRICAEAIPFTESTTRLRTQVCGKYLAQQLRSPD